MIPSENVEIAKVLPRKRPSLGMLARFKFTAMRKRCYERGEIAVTSVETAHVTVVALSLEEGKKAAHKVLLQEFPDSTWILQLYC